MDKFQLIELGRLGEKGIGYLTVAQSPEVPFSVQRVYWIYGTPPEVVRGNHSHKALKQILVCLHGKVTILLEDARGRTDSVLLESPSIGLYLPPGYWRTMLFESESVLMCMASMVYDEADYLRDYKEFSKHSYEKKPDIE